MKRISRWVVYHPKSVIVILGVITLFFLAFVPGIGFLSNLEKMLPQDDPVVEEYEEAKDTFGSQNIIMVALENDRETVFNISTLRKLFAMTAELEELEDQGYLEDVISPSNVDIIEGTELALIVRPILKEPPQNEEEVQYFREKILQERQLVNSIILQDSTAAVIILKVAPRVADDTAKIHQLMHQVTRITKRYEGPERIYLAGDTVLEHFADQYMKDDLKLLFPIAVLVVMLSLYLSFRSLRGVFLPLIVVLISVAWTVGLMAIFGIQLTLASIFLPVLLTAIGSAYGIHIINSYYEKAASGISQGKSKQEMIIETMEEMNLPVVMAALTTAAGFLSLLNTFLTPIKHFGIFSAVGVLFALAFSLTFIPAVLALQRVPKAVERRGVEGTVLERLLGRAGRVIGRNSGKIMIVSAIILGIFLAGVTLLKVETNISKYFKEDSPVIQGMDFVEAKFGGSLQMSVIVDTGKKDGVKDPAVLKKMDQLQGYLESLDYIGDTSSLVDMVKDINFSLHGDDPEFYSIPDNIRLVAQELLLYEMGGGEVLKSVATFHFDKAQVTARVKSVTTAKLQRLVDEVTAYLKENFQGVATAKLVGLPKVFIELSNKLVKSQITSLGWSMFTVWLIVSLLMGSFVAGGIAMLPLIFTVGLNFGLMSYSGISLDIATVMISSIVIGIGVDYGVHFISRYRREIQRGKDHDQALITTLTTTGKGITYNAITLTLGFLVLILSHFGALGTFGWLIALTMVTSSISALVIIPAVLKRTEPKFLYRPAYKEVRAWDRLKLLRRGKAVEPNLNPDPEPDDKEVKDED
jgi:predicted RND superfamily exporter protein